VHFSRVKKLLDLRPLIDHPQSLVGYGAFRWDPIVSENALPITLRCITVYMRWLELNY
jgi:hypothetical protein